LEKKKIKLKMPQPIYFFILVFQVLFLVGGQSSVQALTSLQKEYTQPLNYLYVSQSPFIAEYDVIVHKGAKLIVEPGCEIRFAKGKELTVFGVLDARGNSTHRIKFTKIGIGQKRDQRSDKNELLRLVEGEDMLSGKLQIFYNSKWNYVCSTQFK